MTHEQSAAVERMRDEMASFGDMALVLAALDEAQQDAARYQWLRYRTMGLRDNEGRQYFGFPSMFGLRPVTNIMQGGVGQHLDAAIDAARASAGGAA